MTENAELNKKAGAAVLRKSEFTVLIKRTLKQPIAVSYYTRQPRRNAALALPVSRGGIDSGLNMTLGRSHLIGSNSALMLSLRVLFKAAHATRAAPLTLDVFYCLPTQTKFKFKFKLKIYSTLKCSPSGSCHWGYAPVTTSPTLPPYALSQVYSLQRTEQKIPCVGNRFHAVWGLCSRRLLSANNEFSV